MAHQQTCLFAVPSRYHDVQQAEELVQKREVQARLGLRRRRLWVVGGHIGHARGARRLEEESAVGIKRRLLGGVYDNFGRRVAIRHVDGPGAIFVLESRVPPQKPSARLLLCASVFVQSPASIASAYDGE